MAQLKGDEIPKVDLNLPPNFLNVNFLLFMIN